MISKAITYPIVTILLVFSVYSFLKAKEFWYYPQCRDFADGVVIEMERTSLGVGSPLIGVTRPIIHYTTKDKQEYEILDDTITGARVGDHFKVGYNCGEDKGEQVMNFFNMTIRLGQALFWGFIFLIGALLVSKSFFYPRWRNLFARRKND